MWINTNNDSNLSFKVLTEWEIDQIETTAIEAAMHIASQDSDLMIVTDSEITLKNIQYWQIKGAKEKAKCNSADVIHCIIKIMDEKNLEVEFKHIYSHIKEKSNINNVSRCFFIQ